MALCGYFVDVLTTDRWLRGGSNLRTLDPQSRAITTEPPRRLATPKIAYYKLLDLRQQGTVFQSGDKLKTQTWTEFSYTRKVQLDVYQTSTLQIVEVLTITSLYIQEVILHTVSTQQTRRQDFSPAQHMKCYRLVFPPHHLSLNKK